VIAVRADEAEHRDVNHRLANELDQKRAERKADKREPEPPAPPAG
jgi:hypothetical protein